ncbi:MAG: phosphoribosylglycinamide formyltransferase [Phycisphaerae bacterium]|nr:phosphoribosylglycinamide formyltransferase [Phycisphaerae bacterium]
MPAETSVPRPLRLAVLISGGGRTMVNLAEKIRGGELDAKIVLVISSRPDVAGVERARELDLPVQCLDRREFDSVETYSDAVWEAVQGAAADLVCLAGFLHLLRIPTQLQGRVLNIHPALLPRFGGRGMYGRHVHEAVLAAGASESGCTVHFADAKYDEGQIILQQTCPVRPDDTPETLAARVFEQECIAYPQAIRQVAANWKAGAAARP